jgi:hypothetical protein
LKRQVWNDIFLYSISHTLHYFVSSHFSNGKAWEQQYSIVFILCVGDREFETQMEIFIDNYEFENLILIFPIKTILFFFSKLRLSTSYIIFNNVLRNAKTEKKNIQNTICSFHFEFFLHLRVMTVPEAKLLHMHSHWYNHKLKVQKQQKAIRKTEKFRTN